MKRKYLIIYHKEDNDGLFSMAINYVYLTCEGHYDATVEDTPIIDILGSDYNDLDKLDIYKDIIDKGYTNVILTDISFDDMNKMKELYSYYKYNFCWIDHHQSSIDKSKEYGIEDIKGIRLSNHSALYNSFSYLYGFIGTVPTIFKILSAWDSWTYEQEHINFDFCRYVNTGVSNYFKLDPKKIINFVKDIIYIYHAEDEQCLDIVKYFRKSGKNICDYEESRYSELIKNYGDFSWTVNNRSACVLFIQGPTSSLIFKSCKSKVKNGIIFKRFPDGNWGISLYNTDNQHDFHCGNYLKEHYNGGGHEGAAGAQISEKTFIKLLSNKKI